MSSGTCSTCGTPPGRSPGQLRRSALDNIYAKLVNKHLFEIPPRKGPVPEPTIPSVLVDWEPGDELADVDWRASVIARGRMASGMPLLRQKLVDEPVEIKRGLPACEIWVDTSGSMPDPTEQLNALTLSALVLSAACLRKKGKVRGAIWSSGLGLAQREWLTSEGAARTFFLQYYGGGTVFPMKDFQRWSHDKGPAQGAIRVVISDTDLNQDQNFQVRDGRIGRSGYSQILLDIARHSGLVVFVLAGGRAIDPEAFEIARNIRVVVVNDYADMPGTMKGLAKALFGD